MNASGARRDFDILSVLGRYGFSSLRSKISISFAFVTMVVTLGVVVAVWPYGPLPLASAWFVTITITHSLLARAIYRSLLKSIAQIAEASDSLRNGVDAARAVSSTNDEFASLSESFNLAVDHVFAMLDSERADHEITLDEAKDDLNRLHGELAAATERERDLEDALAKYKTMFDEAPVGYHELDHDGRVTRVNKTELQMLGYSADEVIGKHTSEFVIEKASREAVANLLSGKAPLVSYERTFRHKDGHGVPVLLDNRLIRNAQGEVVGVRTTIQDIGSLKRAQAELTSERDLLHTLMNNLPMGVYFKDMGHRFTRVSKAQAELLGLSDPAQAVGRSEADFLEPGYAARAIENEEKAIENGNTPITSVDCVLTQDGRRRWLSSTVVPVRNEVGAVTGVIGISRDITERRTVESALESGLSELLDLVSSVSRGDLTGRGSEGEDILGKISVAVNRMLENFSEAIAQVKQLGFSVSSSATEILASASQMALGSERQASEITETSSAVEQMAASMNLVSMNATASAEAAQRAMRMAELGNGAVRETFEAMRRIEQSVKRAADEVQALAKRNSEISEIVNLIDDIASQTNLLSLNAAIQAAHAGDAGLGFSVVADEVRKLAERSGAATKQVNSLIRMIVAETDRTFNAMHQCVSEVRDGSTLVEQARLAIKDTSAAVRLSTELIEEIAAASHQQANVTKNVSGAMQVVSSIALQTSAGAYQTAETVRGMADLSERLNDAMSRFNLDAEFPVNTHS